MKNKRKRIKKNDYTILYFLLIILIVVVIVIKDTILYFYDTLKEQWNNLESPTIKILIVLFLIFLIILFIIITRKNKKKKAQKLEEEKKLEEEQKRLNKEIDEFWEKQELAIKMAKQKVISEAFKAHERQLMQEQEKLKKQYQYGYRDNMTGYEYEQYCAKLFKCYGWEAEVTPKSGDFGVDIIAKKNGIKIVAQCKKWNGSVGFNAVKEVFTGKTINKADYAIVITNSNFSQAAKKGAKDTGVILIKHSELEDCLNGLLRYENK